MADSERFGSGGPARSRGGTDTERFGRQTSGLAPRFVPGLTPEEAFTQLASIFNFNGVTPIDAAIAAAREATDAFIADQQRFEADIARFNTPAEEAVLAPPSSAILEPPSPTPVQSPPLALPVLDAPLPPPTISPGLGSLPPADTPTSKGEEDFQGRIRRGRSVSRSPEGLIGEDEGSVPALQGEFGTRERRRRRRLKERGKF